MIDFGPIRRRELRAAAELAARAFEDYEYFTNYFPNPDESACFGVSSIGST